MTNQQEVDFVQYLRDRQLISQPMADDVRGTSTGERIPLGRLLLEEGALGVRDVMKVLTIQVDKPGERFGEIALRLGLITSTQLDDALQRQATARQHQIEIIRRKGLLQPSELQTLVAEYIRFLERRINARDVAGDRAAKPIAPGE